MTNTISSSLLDLTAQVVAAYVAHNHLTPETLQRLIASVFGALASTGMSAPVPEKPQPAVAVRRSVFPDHIVCLEDGKKLKMLKRHLKTSYDLTPDQYRAKWGLPSSYPMVAPDYAARRSELAKQIGLGVKPWVAPPPVMLRPPVARRRPPKSCDGRIRRFRRRDERSMRVGTLPRFGDPITHDNVLYVARDSDSKSG